jgi:hypothetical protein
MEVMNGRRIAASVAWCARLCRVGGEVGHLTEVTPYLNRRLMGEATYPAPNPLSIFTTLTLEAQEFIIPNNAASPLNAAP